MEIEQEFLTVQEVARILNISVMSVRRRFEHYPGVIDVSPARPLYGRPYRTLRIPRGVLRLFIEENEVRRKAEQARSLGKRPNRSARQKSKPPLRSGSTAVGVPAS